MLKKTPVEIVYMPTDALIPYARNSRTHSASQVAQIAASIREFGFTNPVLIDGDSGIIAGHGRVMAAQKLAMAEVPCIVLDYLTPAERRAYVIADNKLAMNAGWDDEMLRLEIEGLRAEGFDLDLTGFTGDELASLMADEGIEEGMTEEDEVPQEQEHVVTWPGDVWVMGRHRLLCGDCTDEPAVLSLLGGEKPALCLTDPPYGLGSKKASGKNDYAEYEDTRENLVNLAARWLPIARDNCAAVVFSPGVTNQWIYPEPNWVFCWFYGGGQLRSSWGFNCWQPFLCYGKDPSLASGNGGRPDAVNLNTPANSGDLDHPCPKPVKLWEWLLERLAFKKTTLLYEPFSGSGTTIIAAEKMGHCVRALELTPKYVDIAVRRWQAFTGKQATLEGDGRTFDEVAAERTQEVATP